MMAALRWLGLLMLVAAGVYEVTKLAAFVSLPP